LTITFLAVYQQAEHTTLDGDALAATTCATGEGLSDGRQFAFLSEGGNIRVGKESDIAHGVSP
jgi:hypothetical protein